MQIQVGKQSYLTAIQEYLSYVSTFVSTGDQSGN